MVSHNSLFAGYNQHNSLINVLLLIYICKKPKTLFSTYFIEAFFDVTPSLRLYKSPVRTYFQICVL
jgi:hypothetical protein